MNIKRINGVTKLLQNQGDIALALYNAFSNKNDFKLVIYDDLVVIFVYNRSISMLEAREIIKDYYNRLKNTDYGFALLGHRTEKMSNELIDQKRYHFKRKGRK